MSNEKNETQEQLASQEQDKNITADIDNGTVKDRSPEPQLSNRQRRQLEQANRENQAPADLFTKSNEKRAVFENPERVEIIKAQLEEYTRVVRKGMGDGAEVKAAIDQIHRAVANLHTLKGKSLRKAHNLFLKAISEHPQAFATPLPFMYPERFVTPRDRNNYAQYINVIIAFSKLHDKKAIHSRVDLVRAFADLPSDQSAEMILLFPAK